MSSANQQLKNWGPCVRHGCGVLNGPRCLSNLCIGCCLKEHDYWLGHTMADGKASGATKGVQEKLAPHPLDPPAPAEPLKPVVPEPGKLTELEEGADILVSTPDNGYLGAKGGKSGFPISYVK